MQASIINSRNYSRWRHKGVAYELREGSYNTSNRTLASGKIFKHVCFKFILTNIIMHVLLIFADRNYSITDRLVANPEGQLDGFSHWRLKFLM